MSYQSLRALRNPNYRPYFWGQLISMAGSRMQSLVQAWIVFQMTHSGLWLGIIQFSGDAAALLASPMAGVIADRYPRKTLTFWITLVGLVQASMMTALFFSGALRIWHIALLSSILGVASSFEITTRHAFAMDIVGREDLSSALNLNSICTNGSRIFGPAIAGAVIATFGERAEGWCFFGNAVSYIAVLVSVYLIQVGPQDAEIRASGHFLSHFIEGVRYVRTKPQVLFHLALSMFLSFLGFTYLVIFPVFSRQTLHGDANQFAWLTAWMGIGAIVAGLGVGSELGIRAGDEPSVNRRMLIDTVLMGLSFATLGMARSPWVAYLAVTSIGYFLMGTFPKINHSIQSQVKSSMRGRVVSLYTMTFLSAGPLGCLLAGALVDVCGAPWVSVGIGAISALAGISALLRMETGKCSRLDQDALQSR